MYVPDAEPPHEFAPQEPHEDGGEDRVSYRELVVALARRNQRLARLQLELVQQLNNELASTGRVTTLFQFERLAGKMRRNNDNLVALSRSEAESQVDPVAFGEVLLAAVSEIGQHERVAVQTPPSARIAGRAAGDLTRLLAELLDNAVTFSGAETQVALETSVTEGGGLLVGIEDLGVGMTDAQIALATARLAGRSAPGTAPSSPVGLLVAGRLAGRHGVGVTVHHGRDGVGVGVAVTVPADLVTDLRETVPIPLLTPAPAAIPPLPEETAGPAEPAGDPGVLGDWRQDPHSGSLWPEPLASPAESEPLASPAGSEPLAPAVESEALASPAESEPLAEPEAGHLFESTNTDKLTEWWHGEPPSDVTLESTPIFDEMVSAWFRSPSAASDSPAGAGQPAASATGAWDSAADAGWRVVEAVSRSGPTSFTEAGLPRRRQGEQLMPGAIAPATSTIFPAPDAGRDRPARDAAGVRGRLSNFQRGLKLGRRGRHRAGQPDDPPDGTQG
ncbi:ATP-binding protein [Amycolatopsis taiwanensis]|uniref:ATP-binding protein n=1 Tax=Amycolatopsis taiwanensis TaxID=342230 RepID=UPI00048518F2|nr:ATP-binding protein [Amycolatopsis taiwanensis]